MMACTGRVLPSEMQSPEGIFCLDLLSWPSYVMHRVGSCCQARGSAHNAGAKCIILAIKPLAVSHTTKAAWHGPYIVSRGGHTSGTGGQHAPAAGGSAAPHTSFRAAAWHTLK